MCLVAKGSYSVSNTQVVQVLLPHSKADFLVSNQRSTNGALDLQGYMTKPRPYSSLSRPCWLSAHLILSYYL